MKFQKETVLNIVKATAFLLILLLLFLFFTYLFRDTSDSKRGNILNFHAEPENTLDVVTVGASTIHRYWDPMRAWKTYGFTSYNYATSAMSAGTYLAGLKDALKNQSPELVIVEARLFTRADTKEDNTMAARHLLDCLDYDLSRLQAVKYYCDTVGISWEDSIDLYVDLIYYHDNYKAFVNQKNRAYADNRAESRDSLNKGYFPNKDVGAFEDPSDNLLVARKDLDAQAERYLRDILEYCRDENIRLLLVATPVVINKTEAARFAQIGKIAEEYGVPFLDANLHYEEMGIDFSQDFSDKHHTSVLGADKFTDFLAKYLVENYDLPSHKGDPAYTHWETGYESYLKSSNAAREKVQKIIENREQAFAGVDRMQQTEDLQEWLTLTDNEEFTLFALSVNPAEGNPPAEVKSLLQRLGIEDSYWNKPFAVMYCNEVVQKGTENEISGKMSNSGHEYTVSATGDCKLEINNTNYVEESFDGIQIVVYSDTYMKVIDQIQITWQPDGELRLTHK